VGRVNVLGISSGFHDAAAALVVDGRIVAAVEQERLTRRKHDPSFPAEAMDACLAIGGIEAEGVDVVVLHEHPVSVIDRHVASRLRSGPTAARALLADSPGWIMGRAVAVAEVDRWFRARDARLPELHVAEHHTSHGAAAFYASPFEHAAVLTIDGVGEWATCAVGVGDGHRLRLEREIRYPHSVGLLYSAFTTYCGFRANTGEGELMGLAPFGEPRYAEQIRRHLVRLLDDGGIAIDQRYFAYASGRRMTNRRFHHLFDGPPRPLHAEPTRREADLAASIQEVLGEIFVHLARAARRLTSAEQICLGGGVALNCVANSALRASGTFEQVWAFPAPGDSGSAVGAALWWWHEVAGNPRPGDPDPLRGAALGPAFEPAEVAAWLAAQGVAHQRFDGVEALADQVAERLERGQVVGWFQGPMEFGPRALGHRSIVADPRSPTVRQRLNAMVKERAMFRPFAPSVLVERAADWFEPADPVPYMTFTARLRAEHLVDADIPAAATVPEAAVVPRSLVPAVTHVDGSARVQTVDPATRPAFGALLRAFEARTGCPMVLNTSFNGRDEPIVCTPDDALATARRIGLDALAVEGCLVELAP
jgi:carbamoyltransferase